MFKNNVYSYLEELFSQVDKFKARMIEKKEDLTEVRMCKNMIQYYTDIINNTLVGNNGIFGGARNV